MVGAIIQPSSNLFYQEFLKIGRFCIVNIKGWHIERPFLWELTRQEFDESFHCCNTPAIFEYLLIPQRLKVLLTLDRLMNIPFYPLGVAKVLNHNMLLTKQKYLWYG